MSRSEFFTRAANRYLDATFITEQIDAALEAHPDADESNRGLRTSLDL